MLRVNVSFPSGSGDTLLLPEHSKVGDLKILAQSTFRKGFLRLITVGGHVLSNPEDSLQAAGVQRRAPNGCGATAAGSHVSHRICVVVLWM